MTIRGYERLTTISVQEALKAIAQKRPLEFDGHICYTGSNRLLTYHVHGVSCCVPGCTLSGQYFAIEKTANQKSAKYHLNLYCIRDGREIMITSDHRIPKSKGGLDNVNNRQPMCYPHNSQKGNQLIYL